MHRHIDAQSHVQQEANMQQHKHSRMPRESPTCTNKRCRGTASGCYPVFLALFVSAYCTSRTTRWSANERNAHKHLRWAPQFTSNTQRCDKDKLHSEKRTNHLLYKSMFKFNLFFKIKKTVMKIRQKSRWKGKNGRMYMKERKLRQRILHYSPHMERGRGETRGCVYKDERKREREGRAPEFFLYLQNLKIAQRSESSIFDAADVVAVQLPAPQTHTANTRRCTHTRIRERGRESGIK